MSTKVAPAAAIRVADIEWTAWASRACAGRVEGGAAALAARLSAGAVSLSGGSVLLSCDVVAAAAAERGTLGDVSSIPQRWFDSIKALPSWAAAVAVAAASASDLEAAPAAPAAPGAAKKDKNAGAALAAAAAVSELCKYTSAVDVNANDAPIPLFHALANVFSDAIKTAFPEAVAMGLSCADILVNTEARFTHHYQCNNALMLFAKLRGPPVGGRPKKAKVGDAAVAAALVEEVVIAAPPSPAPAPAPVQTGPASPVAVAAAIVAAVTASGPHAFIGRLEVSGPGYINIYLAHNYVVARLSSLLAVGPRGARPPGMPPRRVAIDYSSPNIAKDMHIGHLRSTIIGDAIGRILEFGGHAVDRINHVGDWGTQFGMLIAHVKDMLAAGVADADLDENISDLTNFYRQAKVRFDGKELDFAWKKVRHIFPGGPEFKDRAHREVVALQAGDVGNYTLWRRMVNASASMFSVVYKKLGIDPRLELRGESFYNAAIPLVVKELEEKGLLEVSNGALVLRVAGQEVPLMVRKSDGGFGYDSTDLAALHHRLFTLKSDWLIYVVDSGQSLHFDLVFAGGRAAGWYTEGVTAQVQHTGFGVVQGESEDPVTGKKSRTKLKTRSGDTVRLVDVLEEARIKAHGIITERAASGGSALAGATPEEIDTAACALGYGGVKYFDLRQSRLQDYLFSSERMLSADGDTATYIQYSRARLSSILRKGEAAGAAPPRAGVNLSSAADLASMWIWEHSSESLLAAHILRFAEVIAGIQEDLMPHKLCEFMYALSGKATDFIRDCHVLGELTRPALRASRLKLVAVTLDTLTQCMVLLGIEPLDRI